MKKKHEKETRNENVKNNIFNDIFPLFKKMQFISITTKSVLIKCNYLIKKKM